jgi:hypothetical protein
MFRVGSALARGKGVAIDRPNAYKVLCDAAKARSRVRLARDSDSGHAWSSWNTLDADRIDGVCCGPALGGNDFNS